MAAHIKRNGYLPGPNDNSVMSPQDVGRLEKYSHELKRQRIISSAAQSLYAEMLKTYRGKWSVCTSVTLTELAGENLSITTVIKYLDILQSAYLIVKEKVFGYVGREWRNLTNRYWFRTVEQAKGCYAAQLAEMESADPDLPQHPIIVSINVPDSNFWGTATGIAKPLSSLSNSDSVPREIAEDFEFPPLPDKGADEKTDLLRKTDKAADEPAKAVAGMAGADDAVAEALEGQPVESVSCGDGLPRPAATSKTGLRCDGKPHARDAGRSFVIVLGRKLLSLAQSLFIKQSRQPANEQEGMGQILGDIRQDSVPKHKWTFRGLLS